jgi:hypothetical protein
MSSPSNETVVSISATVEINGQQVTVNTQDVRDLASGNIIFSISEPITLGTPEDFVGWLAGNLGIDVDLHEIESQLPDVLKEPFESFMTGKIILTVLSVNSKTKVYKLGVVFKLETPFNILDDLLEFDSIGIMVENSSQS